MTSFIRIQIRELFWRQITTSNFHDIVKLLDNAIPDVEDKALNSDIRSDFRYFADQIYKVPERILQLNLLEAATKENPDEYMIQLRIEDLQRWFLDRDAAVENFPDYYMLLADQTCTDANELAQRLNLDGLFYSVVFKN